MEFRLNELKLALSNIDWLSTWVMGSQIIVEDSPAVLESTSLGVIIAGISLLRVSSDTIIKVLGFPRRTHAMRDSTDPSETTEAIQQKIMIQ